MQPQSMYVWVGLDLIGCPRGSGSRKQLLVQGVIYTVTGITETELKLQLRCTQSTARVAPATRPYLCL